MPCIIECEEHPRLVSTLTFVSNKLSDNAEVIFPVIKIISKTKKCKKAKWLSEEALKISIKRREVKGKGEKERYTHLNAEFQRTARRNKKAFLSDQFKQRKTIEWERLEISSREISLEIPWEYFMQRWAQ